MHALTRRRVAVAFLSPLLVLGMASTPGAQAYPPGNKPQVFVKKFTVKPGKPVKARTINVKPGCRVTFTFTGPVNKRPKNSFKAVRKAKANKRGVADVSLRKGPKKKGRYHVISKGGGNGCGRKFTTRTSFVVAKKSGGRG